MKRIMGEKISKLREARQMTQQNLAQILGVSLSTVFKWEKALHLQTVNFYQR